MSTFTKEYTLDQHTMLIHFQAQDENYENERDIIDGKNVCLRASEVKPKLDRFLVRKMGGELDKSWIQSRNANEIDIALKYRMTIRARDVNLVVARKIPKIFYGNIGNGNKKNAVMFPNGVTVKIVCMIPDLLDKINELIGEFFCRHKFWNNAG